MTKRIVLLAAAATALAGVVPAASAEDPDGSLVAEVDITRQAENTLPTDSWVLYTRTGTPVTAGAFVADAGAPLGDGSLLLSTVTGGEKVFLLNFDHVGTKLSDIDDISYSTNRSAGTAQQVAALNAVIDFNGPDVTGGFSTLVFEPVYNTAQGTVSDGVWQSWSGIGNGTWWSTRPINGQCAGATATCDKTWDEIVANNPDATILGGVGVNQGGGNGGLITSVDAFTFDATTYDFELVGDADGDGVKDDVDAFPTDPGETADSDGDGVGDNSDAFPNDPNETKDADGDGLGENADTNTKADCKGAGFQRFTAPVFKNQGECVKFHEAK